MEEIEHIRFYRQINGKMVRETVGLIREKTFITNRLSRKHFFRLQAGYPFSLKLIEELRNKGIKKIRIVEHREVEGTTLVYETSIHDFSNLVPFQEEGQDMQVCLPLRLWKQLGN